MECVSGFEDVRGEGRSGSGRVCRTSLRNRVVRSGSQGRAARPCRRQPRRGDLDGRESDAIMWTSPATGLLIGIRASGSANTSVHGLVLVDQTGAHARHVAVTSPVPRQAGQRPASCVWSRDGTRLGVDRLAHRRAHVPGQITQMRIEGDLLFVPRPSIAAFACVPSGWRLRRVRILGRH